MTHQQNITKHMGLFYSKQPSVEDKSRGLSQWTWTLLQTYISTRKRHQENTLNSWFFALEVLHSTFPESWVPLAWDLCKNPAECFTKIGGPISKFIFSGSYCFCLLPQSSDGTHWHPTITVAYNLTTHYTACDFPRNERTFGIRLGFADLAHLPKLEQLLVRATPVWSWCF